MIRPKRPPAALLTVSACAGAVSAASYYGLLLLGLGRHEVVGLGFNYVWAPGGLVASLLLPWSVNPSGQYFGVDDQTFFVWAAYPWFGSVGLAACVIIVPLAASACFRRIDVLQT